MSSKFHRGCKSKSSKRPMPREAWVRASLRPQVSAVGLHRIRFSRVVYRCDVSRVEGRVIPLGVICDLSVGNLYALGLIARERLSDDEAAPIGVLVRERVRSPFTFLKHDFDMVWSAKDELSAFESLASVGLSAIDFSRLYEAKAKVPASLRALSNDKHPLEEWAKDQMSICLRTEFWRLVGDQRVPSPEQKKEVLNAAA
jgi:hypothetical protein